MRRSLILFALGTMTLGCSASNDNPQFGTGGSSGNFGQQGCTTDPDCGKCSDCFSLCVCTTGDAELCKPACNVGSGGSSGAGGSGGSSGGGGSGGSTTTGPLAAGLRITEIAVYQAVKIPLMQNGAPVTATNAPVVAGRDAMLRVSVAPDPGYQPREIIAKLELPGQAPIQVNKLISAASVEGDLNSTFTLDVPGAMITPGIGYSVSLLEATPGSQAGATDGARFPAQGEAPTNAQSSNGPIKIVIVPMVSNGFSPDTSAQRLEQLRRRMLAMYPVPDVSFTLRQAVSTVGLSANGAGFDQALDTVINVRQQDGAPFNAYYYGVLAPAQSAQQFCGFGCVAGLSVQASANDSWGRASVGIAYFADGSSLDAPDTMAHEVGHANGLPHAPCQTQDAGQFPYAGGVIGSWGYDLTNKTLLNPSSYKDVMGYCNPDWISDFNYNRLFNRISFVNSNAEIVAASDPARAAGQFRTATLGVDGKLRWGSLIETTTPQTGELREVALLDASGKSIGSVSGFYYPFHHLEGGMLFVRQTALVSQPGIASIKPAGLGNLAL